MNKFFAYRRYLWSWLSLLLHLLALSYLTAWLTLLLAPHIPQSVCNPTSLPPTPLFPPTTTTTNDLPSNPLHDLHTTLLFTQHYVLLSPHPDLHALAPLLGALTAPLDALAPARQTWSRALSFYIQDLQTHHMLFTAHWDACLAYPQKRPPRPVLRRMLHPSEEALSVLQGYFGTLPPPLSYFHGRHAPTSIQLHAHIKHQYALFRRRTSTPNSPKTLLADPTLANFTTWTSNLTTALHALRNHTTTTGTGTGTGKGKGKGNKSPKTQPTMHLLHNDMATNPTLVTQTLHSLGWSPTERRDAHQLARTSRGAFAGIENAVAEAGAYVRKMTPYILRTERDFVELDRRFGDVEAGDVVRGRGGAAVERFEAQLGAVVVLVRKVGITEVGWEVVRERAEREL